MIPISEAEGSLSYIPPVLRKKLTTLPLYFYCYDSLVLANFDRIWTLAINTSICVNSEIRHISLMAATLASCKLIPPLSRRNFEPIPTHDSRDNLSTLLLPESFIICPTCQRSERKLKLLNIPHMEPLPVLSSTVGVGKCHFLKETDSEAMKRGLVARLIAGPSRHWLYVDSSPSFPSVQIQNSN